MTVKELIEKLKDYDWEMDVCLEDNETCYVYDIKKVTKVDDDFILLK